MKLRLVLPSMIFCCTLVASSAQAFFGQMGPLGPRATSGLEMLGVYLGHSTGLTGVMGQARFGIGSEKWDLGLEGAYSKPKGGGGSSIGAQVDLKGALVHLSSNKNVHLGGDLGVNFDHASGSTRFGFSAIPGISVASGDDMDGVISGWGGLGIAWNHYSGSSAREAQAPAYGTPASMAGRFRSMQIARTAASGSSQSSAVLRLGASYDFSSKLGLAGELNHTFAGGGSDAFLVGVNFGMGGKPSGATMH